MRLEFAISPRRIALFLGILSIYFALQSLIVEYLIENVLDNEVYRSLVMGLDLFSVNAEQTIPTWYSTLLLFAAAVVIALIAVAKKSARDRYWRHWLGLAVLFIYLSMDEGAVIHEILADGLQTTLNLTGFLTFGWQIVAGPLVILVGLLYLRFLFHLPRRTRYLFLLAGLLYVGGALVVEGISANQWYLNGGQTFGYLAIATIEECCEMLGVVVFIYAALDYALQMQHAYVFQLQPASRATAVEFAPASPPGPLPSNTVLAAAGSRRTGRSFLQMRPMLVVPISIIGLNIALVSWAFTTTPPPVVQVDIPALSTQAALDQIVTDDVVMTRLVGTFGVDNLPSRRIAGALLESYDDVMVITMGSTGSSIALAAEKLPFSRDSLTDLLRASGETQFIVFDTLAVKAIVGKP